MYKHLFGPVPSRRLGMSLGVDLVPHKVCSLNCIYCECGRTTRLTMERDEYIMIKDVLKELGHFFKHNPDPEYITFSGAGEPTLHSQMGEVLKFLKELRPELPVAVLTNGTLLSNPEVREELVMADLVLPSLDAATDEAFRKINRPPKGFTIEQYVDGLIQFKRGFRGALWLEVLILPGYNDDTENILALKKAIESIGPDRIQLNTLDRPGVIENLRPASLEELEKIAGDWGLDNVEIVAPVVERQMSASFRSDVENAILETISRRPCTLDDLKKILGIHVNEINKYLGSLEETEQIETIRQDRRTFYQIRKS